ncbi:metalloregulator ArsR/SmtB family transcription factor [Alicyclobacillus sp. SO9]|uniref:DUF2087 domain-containing protein n=1 Tax=Alicyclobacillus sp. SO9 TaxID=2665646 RepID=UPI0018E85BB8|nr:metalloregulator ArsR/SmtB family transcription factor [Alicyclobacillus sp. SO9]QQE77188.1 metalloregulator ArsR/SmtB family transcription factor [Alicyclobacillus sp. SO9]
MQLDKLVTYHKALSDPTRIRILFLLRNGPLHGQALAGKLGLSAPTITHHMMKLRNAGIVREKRDKNTIYFALNEQLFKQNAQAILKAFFCDPAVKLEDEDMENKKAENSEFESSVINNFFTLDGVLKQIPAQRKRKLVVFEHMIKELEPGRKYAENEINDYIKRFHEDYCTIRREFIINHFMYREKNVYELNPREMWTDWRAL